MLRILIYPVFCLVFFPLNIWANVNQVSGSVVDVDGNYLPGVNVVIKSSDAIVTGGFTDENGFYSIANVSTGTYTIQLSHIGYRTLNEQIHVTKKVVLMQDFMLRPTVFMLTQNVVSASKRPEKILYTPASIFLLVTDEVKKKAVLNLTDHVQDIPGVDFAQTGLVQSSVVTRGFNNTFPSALLTLTDNRIASLPSLRVNWGSFIPITNEDVERIEVVLGPGSALYGPNSANGVIHIITKSPFESAGTNVKIGIGERSLRRAGLRHAGVFNERLGYKISTQYYTATDWKYQDPQEPNKRNYDIEKQSLELRLDYRPTTDIQAILSVGHSQSDQIQMSGLGAIQLENWKYNFIQGRFIYHDWFAQLYQNRTHSGDSWLLRSGNPTIDKSSQTVFQLQHSSNWREKQEFVYGLDLLFTRPETEGTINGANETYDGVDEFGLYLQTERQVTRFINLVGALRLDTHSGLNKPVTSLRSAAVLKPNPTNTIRLTYNNAFRTPTTNNLYLDLVASPDPFRVGANFAPALGYSPAIPLRAQGTYIPNAEQGFTFRRGEDGRPLFRSPFARLANFENDPYLALDDHAFNNEIWGLVRGSVLANFIPQAEALFAKELVESGHSDETAQEQAKILAESLRAIIPTELTGLTNALKKFDPQTGRFKSFSDVRDIPRTKSTLTRTLELGYKGVVGNKFVLTADLYRTQTKNFVGPLVIETPNVFLDKNSLENVLAQGIEQASNSIDPTIAASLLTLDQAQAPDFIEGNGDGSIADELAALFSSTAAQIPFGTVTPEQAYDPNAVLLTFRNFGDVTHNGLDFSLTYYPTDHLTLNGNYSYVSKNIYKNVESVSDIGLNAPKNKLKLAINHRIPDWGLGLGFSMRYTDSFPMVSGIYVGTVDSYTTVNTNLSYDLPLKYDVSLRINATNILNRKYRSFVGAPLIGRMAFGELGFAF
ncbi:MAG: TonB-dependent receptor [Gemmatimonadetes bacterium]|nr:TonB-dependent receptor [Gemmatimonadota bacterium]MBT7584742.1 TonB-dependent receptor [Gemmatimonadota bacterium]